MPTAKKLPSGSWRCQVFNYTDTNGKRHYESFTAETKKEAEYMAAEFTLTKHQKSKTSTTFGAALDEYIKNRSDVLSPASIRKYMSKSRNFPDKLMNKKLKDITPDFIQELINEEAKGHSPKTLRDTHGLISAVLKHNRINIMLNTALPKKVRPDMTMPSDNDIKSLLTSVADTDMEIPIYLATFGAMRRGEISALEDSDIEGNVIHISKTMVLSESGNWIVKSPKSFAGDRYIQIPQFVSDKLNGITGHITNLTPNKITSRFSHILASAGIQHFRFHDLRHYNASISHALGVPDAYIMQSCGWGSDRVLKEVYRHALGDRRKDMNLIAINHFENMQHEMQHGMQHKMQHEK